MGTLVGAFVIRNTGAEVEVGTGVGTYFVGGAVSGKQFAVKQSGVPVGVPVGGSGVGCRVGSLDGCCVAPGGRVMVGASVCGRHDRVLQPPAKSGMLVGAFVSRVGSPDGVAVGRPSGQHPNAGCLLRITHLRM